MRARPPIPMQTKRRRERARAQLSSQSSPMLRFIVSLTAPAAKGPKPMPTAQHISRKPCAVPRRPMASSAMMVCSPWRMEPTATFSVEQSTRTPKLGATMAAAPKITPRRSARAAKRRRLRWSPVLLKQRSTAWPPPQEPMMPVTPKMGPITRPILAGSTPCRRCTKAERKRPWPDVTPVRKEPKAMHRRAFKLKSCFRSLPQEWTGFECLPSGTVVKKRSAIKSWGMATT
mmetsp:Transcript_43332/g.97823  ORF Transcript_43332/g.97823 Transcript_43332/m.97823 type:complete len:231 (+) Transcript_43332:236-928(+)